MEPYWTERPAVVSKAGPTLSGTASIQYTGCGGYLLRFGEEDLLVDPFFSNISMWQAAFNKYKTDTVLVNNFFRQHFGHPRDLQGRISTVLISHAHHDHLADVPALLQHNLAAGKVKVYGSGTMVNLLRSFPALVPDTARQFINLEQEFSLMSSTADKKSEPEASPFFYTPGSRIRFLAIPSNHAGHYQFFQPHKIPFTKGHIDAPLPEPPDHALEFKEGQNFNYLIDLLDKSGRPVFRIFSNAGAACDAGVGFPPEELLREKPVDLLLICGASFSIAKDYPFPLLEYLQPRILYVVHWENFFQPIPKLHRKPQVVPNTNIPKLMKALEAFSKTTGYPQTILLEQPLGREISLEF